MPVVECPEEECDYITPDVGDTVGGALIAYHLTKSHPAQAPARPPKLPQPKVKGRITEEVFDSFRKDWERFKEGSALTPAMVNVFLLDCCESELKTDILRESPDLEGKREHDILEAIKKHAVVVVAPSVVQTELFMMRQEHDEYGRSFAAKLKSKARVCKLVKKCKGCLADVSFADEVCKSILLTGLCDEEVRREVLGTANVDIKSLDETIALVEAKEIAMRSLAARSDQAGGLSVLKKTKSVTQSDKRLLVKGPCEKCKVEFLINGLVRKRGGTDEIRRYKICKSCFEKERKVKKADNTPVEEGALSHDMEYAFLGAVSESPPVDDRDSVKSPHRVDDRDSVHHRVKRRQHHKTWQSQGAKYRAARRRGSQSHRYHQSPMSNNRPEFKQHPTNEAELAMVEKSGGNSVVVIRNHIFDQKLGWVEKANDKHPRVKVNIEVKESDYVSIGLSCPSTNPIETHAVTDSGAMCNLIGWKLVERMGMMREDLCKVTGSWSAINGDKVQIMGAVFLQIRGVDDQSGLIVSTAVMAYVSTSTEHMWLSQRSMKDLGIIEEDFPKVKAKPQLASMGDKKAECGCMRRESPPARPDSLPFPARPENVGKMKAWLLDRFATSTFNKCRHQSLPMMKSEPLKIHIDPEATPVAAKTAATVPIHWRDEVKEQLEDDVRMGILKRVPVGTPTVWQHRMHVVAKADGRPRRTVDFRNLNKYCDRETQHVVPPFRQARTVPPNTWKTKTDAWNGYHSCPLREEDQPFTTFITEEGSYMYRVLPQGFTGAGDGYNRRYDDIIEEVDRKTKCVDDVLLWDIDTEMEIHWWRVIDYLILVGVNGVVLNPEKFEFSSKEVEFAGFVITGDGVSPPQRILDSIGKFPKPTNISGVRSWFGLINQVAHYADMREVMLPFKALLSPKTPFKWDRELDEAFEYSRWRIVELIKEGVAIFEPELTTVLSPDWSMSGIGYWLYQKHCGCPVIRPGCCIGGCKVTVCHSQFLSKSEANYWPTEGEALAVAWALEDTKFFTIGCKDLHIITDHKPLISLLGDKPLEEINNRRLVSFRERTSPWKFAIHWVEGKNIPAPDALSRNPQTELPDEDILAAFRMIEEPDKEELTLIAAVQANVNETKAVTWERVKEETERDKEITSVIQLAQEGFPVKYKDMPEELAQYWVHRDKLYVVDSVLLLGDRVVIPKLLREESLRNLHCAHQGCSRMKARASTCIFWPGIGSDIEKKRLSCATCDVIAPSQRRLPPQVPALPTSPFEAVCSDYFDLKGKCYLVTIDRFSGWPDVRQAEKGKEFGAEGLMRICRDLFATFGVPREMSTDGASQFTSRAFQKFIKNWGISHRLSSAYHAQSNGRAEVGVKMIKRLLRDNTNDNGDLNTDEVMRALLAYRNTPDESGMSPAMILMGRQLRDSLPMKPPIMRGISIFASPDVARSWHQMWEAKEIALSDRLAKGVEKVDTGKVLSTLSVGDRVRVQNQTGPNKNKWDKTGTIMQCGDNDQYIVRMDGSRRLSLRNRRFLKQYEKYDPISNNVELRNVPGVGIVSDIPATTGGHSGNAETGPGVEIVSDIPATPGGQSVSLQNVAQQAEIDPTDDLRQPGEIEDQVGDDVPLVDVVSPAIGDRKAGGRMLLELAPHNKFGIREVENPIREERLRKRK